MNVEEFVQNTVSRSLTKYLEKHPTESGGNRLVAYISSHDQGFTEEDHDKIFAMCHDGIIDGEIFFGTTEYKWGRRAIGYRVPTGNANALQLLFMGHIDSTGAINICVVELYKTNKTRGIRKYEYYIPQNCSDMIVANQSAIVALTTRIEALEAKVG